METIGDRLKELRFKKGLSMDEMAKIIGVSSSSVISRYENKQTKPKEKNIIKYADYFNVSVDWLKYGDKKSKDLETDAVCTSIIFNSIVSDYSPEERKEAVKEAVDIYKLILKELGNEN